MRKRQMLVLTIAVGFPAACANGDDLSGNADLVGVVGATEAGAGIVGGGGGTANQEAVGGASAATDGGMGNLDAMGNGAGSGNAPGPADGGIGRGGTTGGGGSGAGGAQIAASGGGSSGGADGGKADGGGAGGGTAHGIGGNTPLDAGSSPGKAPTIAGCPILPNDHIFNTPIDSLAADHSWDSYINGLGVNLHPDFGTSTDMSSDEYYGIPYNVGSGGSLTWTSLAIDRNDDIWEEVDCGNADHSPNMGCLGVNAAYYPLPNSPRVESGLQGGGDHHLLLIDSSTCLLWEFYTGDDLAGSWQPIPGFIFDLKTNSLRPETYTSADAAGFPVLPLLARADEASTGHIAHALRFTMNVTRRAYVWPARHYASTNTAASLPPMGLLLRLKSSYQIPASFGTQSKAILQAMKTYGMYLADNGSDFYFQGEPSAAWQENTFDEMKSVNASNFEAVDLSSIRSRAGWSVDSARVPP